MPLRYRKLTDTGDYSFGNNADDFYTDTDAVGQAVYTSLNLLQGEWWEDTSAGLPLFQHIAGTDGTPDQLRGIDMLIQEAILNVQYVNGISNFTSSYSNRKYTMSCTVQSQFGEIPVEEVTFG